MTTLLSTTPAPVTARTMARVAERGRLIAVAVRDADHDAAVLAWAGFDTVAGIDSVHVVHCYTPLGLHDCPWVQVSRARDDRRRVANRISAVGAARLHARRRELAVNGSALAGRPGAVLVELSSVTDLVVVGADTPGRSTETRGVALEVQTHAECPVVCVPTGYRLRNDRPPVVVIADDTGIPEAAMRFAAGYAHRHGVALQVSRAWASLHEGGEPGATWLAHQQEELDAQLASWRAAYPHIAISARIELDERPLPTLAAHSGLLVLARPTAGHEVADLARPHCPTAVVP